MDTALLQIAVCIGAFALGGVLSWKLWYFCKSAMQEFTDERIRHEQNFARWEEGRRLADRQEHRRIMDATDRTMEELRQALDNWTPPTEPVKPKPKRLITLE